MSVYRSHIFGRLNTVFPPLPRLTPKIAPPPDYYADNLSAVVDHVWHHSADLLGPATGFIQALTALEQQPRRLMARLIMRTTPVIRVDSLNYAEVEDTSAALAALSAASLVDYNPAAGADQLLQRAKVSELKALFPELVAAKDRKADLVQRILCSLTDSRIRQRCADAFHWLRVDPGGHLQQLRLTYFGDLYRDLTEFVMRDLGISDYEDYPLGAHARAFTDLVELTQYLELASAQRLPVQRRASALGWLFEHPRGTQLAPASRVLSRRRNKLLNAWGRDFERGNLIDHAHACYQRATAHPARERRLRLLRKSADPAPAAALLKTMQTAPWSFEEALFAERVDTARRKRPDLWPTSVWHTSHAQLPGVEQLTATLLTRNGGKAWHTENGLLPSLLGLAFWDIVFAPEQGMFTHPFQAGPHDLYWPDFRSRRAVAIDARLHECADAETLWARIAANSRAKHGRACRLVHWGVVTHNNGEILAAARSCFTATQLCGLFDYMLNDLGQVRSGMPDLFVAYGAAAFELIEVKGPTDTLQPNQRVWLQKLRELGIPARVIKHHFQSVHAAAKKRDGAE